MLLPDSFPQTSILWLQWGLAECHSILSNSPPHTPSLRHLSQLRHLGRLQRAVQLMHPLRLHRRRALLLRLPALKRPPHRPQARHKQPHRHDRTAMVADKARLPAPLQEASEFIMSWLKHAPIIETSLPLPQTLPRHNNVTTLPSAVRRAPSSIRPFCPLRPFQASTTPSPWSAQNLPRLSPPHPSNSRTSAAPAPHTLFLHLLPQQIRHSSPPPHSATRS